MTHSQDKGEFVDLNPNIEIYWATLKESIHVFYKNNNKIIYYKAAIFSTG
jgi:hypothetical protein